MGHCTIELAQYDALYIKSPRLLLFEMRCSNSRKLSISMSNETDLSRSYPRLEGSTERRGDEQPITSAGCNTPQKP